MKANFTAGRMTEITGASTTQIQTWERDGLLSPERNSRNHRVFSRDDVRRALELTGQSVKKRIAVPWSTTFRSTVSASTTWRSIL